MQVSWKVVQRGYTTRRFGFWIPFPRLPGSEMQEHNFNDPEFSADLPFPLSQHAIMLLLLHFSLAYVDKKMTISMRLPKV